MNIERERRIWRKKIIGWRLISEMERQERERDYSFRNLRELLQVGGTKPADLLEEEEIQRSIRWLVRWSRCHSVGRAKELTPALLGDYSRLLKSVRR